MINKVFKDFLENTTENNNSSRRIVKKKRTNIFIYYEGQLYHIVSKSNQWLRFYKISKKIQQKQQLGRKWSETVPPPSAYF